MRVPTLILIGCILFVSGCGAIPRDPESTLSRVRGGRFVVGIVQAPSQAEWKDGEASGTEVRLVKRLAQVLGVNPQFTLLGLDEATHQLKEFKIDLLIGGFTSSTVLKNQVAVSRPYDDAEDPPKVFLLPPGENEWLYFVDETLFRWNQPQR